jgi:hypothetical protein
MVRFRKKGIFVVGFWWLWDISDLPLILTTSLTNLVCPKRFPIMALECLDHHPQLRLMTEQLLMVYFGAPSMFIALWFGFDYGTNPPLGTLII